MTSRRIAIIGSGWAGCAAAVELARAGCDVTLLESARTLGGRARRVEIDGRTLDNGQHIMLGAYAESLRLMKLAGVDMQAALLTLPLQMRYVPGAGGMDFIAPRLPAPLHLLGALLRARGLGRADKMSLARFSTTARWMDWKLHNDCSVSELLLRFDQTPRLIDHWNDHQQHQDRSHDDEVFFLNADGACRVEQLQIAAAEHHGQHQHAQRAPQRRVRHNYVSEHYDGLLK